MKPKRKVKGTRKIVREKKENERNQEEMKEGSNYETVGGREVRVKESRKRVKGSGSDVN